MKPWVWLLAAGAVGWYMWGRPRGQVFTDSRQVDVARFLPWPRHGVDPGAIVSRAPYNVDPGR